MANRATGSEPESIFKWQTMEEIGPQDLRYQERTVPGTIIEVELTSGEKVRAWRADDGREYFCHGLTFGGKDAPGGVISPLGDHVPAILRGHFAALPEDQAEAGDILVWLGSGPSDVVHSAILSDPITSPGQKYLDYTTMLQSKNGILPEVNTPLGVLIEKYYGESYNVYRRR